MIYNLEEDIQKHKFSMISVQESIKTINSQVAQQREQLGLQDKIMERNYKSVSDCLTQMEEFKSKALLKDEYLKDMEHIKEESRHTLFSIQDVSKNLDATDNYIEKYFPVKMQELINEAFKYFAKSDEDRENVLDFEVKKYKDFHKVMVKDSGEPTLDKTKVNLPPIDILEKNLKEVKKRNQIRKAVERHDSSFSVGSSPSHSVPGSASKFKDHLREPDSSSRFKP